LIVKSKGALAAILVVAFLAVAGGSFWLGTYYQEQSRTAQMRQFFGGGGQGRPPGTPGGNQQGMANRQQAGPMGINGRVDKVDSNSITITTRMGSQKIEVSSGVKVNKSSPGGIDDIEKGNEIFIQGERKSDGKIQAETIQIIPK
jgi:hypothetical protein